MPDSDEDVIAERRRRLRIKIMNSVAAMANTTNNTSSNNINNALPSKPRNYERKIKPQERKMLYKVETSQMLIKSSRNFRSQNVGYFPRSTDSCTDSGSPMPMKSVDSNVASAVDNAQTFNKDDMRVFKDMHNNCIKDDKRKGVKKRKKLNLNRPRNYLYGQERCISSNMLFGPNSINLDKTPNTVLQQDVENVKQPVDLSTSVSPCSIKDNDSDYVTSFYGTDFESDMDEEVEEKVIFWKFKQDVDKEIENPTTSNNTKRKVLKKKLKNKKEDLLNTTINSDIREMIEVLNNSIFLENEDDNNAYKDNNDYDANNDNNNDKC